MTSAEAISAATINAAYALGRGDRIGSLEPGKAADILLLNTDDYRDLGALFRSQSRPHDHQAGNRHLSRRRACGGRGNSGVRAHVRGPWYSFGVNGFQGVHAAAITPSGRHGEVDYGAAFELLDHLCQGGASGILLFGAAGEYPAFAPDERARLVYLSRKRSRVPVLAGVGSATLDSSIELAREARDAGVAALVLPPPHFFRYDQDDLRAFFCQFAAEAGSDPPILIYRTDAMEVETVARSLADAADSRAVVDAARRSRRVRTAGRRFRARAVRRRRARGALPRARGIVSAAACAVPGTDGGAPSRAALRSRVRYSGARSQSAGISALVRARFPEPAAVKLATGLRGLKTGPLAVPLSPEKQKELDSFRDWFQRWLPVRQEVVRRMRSILALAAGRRARLVGADGRAGGHVPLQRRQLRAAVRAVCAARLRRREEVPAR